MYARAAKIIAAVLVVYAALVATHRGEFWPFSIYPMFSQAGHPWERALVRRLPEGEAARFEWKDADLQALPGESFALVPRGLYQNDLANYVSKTDRWDRQRIDGLRSMFGADSLQSGALLVMRVRGKLAKDRDGDDSVQVAAIPFVLFESDSTRFNPGLSLSASR